MTKHETDELVDAPPHLDRVMRQAFKLPKSFCPRLPPPKVNPELVRKCSFEAISKAPDGEVFSSVHGQIKLMLVAYPVYGSKELIYKNTLNDLLEKMPHTDFLIFTECPPGTGMVAPRYKHMGVHLEEMQGKYEKTGRKIHYVRSRFNHFSCWVRDPFLMGYAVSDQLGSLKSVCIEPNEFLREYGASMAGPSATDAQIADEIVGQHDQYPISLLNSPLVFHGGNVLVGDDFILIGKDYFNIERKMRKLMASEKNPVWEGLQVSVNTQDIKKDFQHWLSPKDKKKIIVLGKKRPNSFAESVFDETQQDIFGRCPIGKKQPFFHLDLFLTLVGRKSEKAPYRVLIGRVVNASDIQNPELENNIIQPWNTWIDQIGEELIQSGFEVSYLPMPLTYGKHRDFTNRRDWFVLSYNNCLVEISKSEKKAWMPTYGTKLADHEPFILDTNRLADFDQQAEQCFRDLGFEVHTLMNYLPHMLYGGSVHCLTNCLLRDV